MAAAHLASALLEAEPALPGVELVTAGLRDLQEGRESTAALLVASFRTRLQELGLSVPGNPVASPEIRLYLKLADERPDAHHHYNGLVQRLVSFVHAAECIR
jgi:hypothetical protein